MFFTFKMIKLFRLFVLYQIRYLKDKIMENLINDFELGLFIWQIVILGFGLFLLYLLYLLVKFLRKNA